jgi:hypothetical protein
VFASLRSQFDEPDPQDVLQSADRQPAAAIAIELQHWIFAISIGGR